MSLLELLGAVLVLFPEHNPRKKALLPGCHREHNLYKKVWLQGYHKDKVPPGKAGSFHL